jgi:cytochrome c-type biogenesis protein
MTNTSQRKTASTSKRIRTFNHALFFVGGFSLIFIVGWGGTATLIGQIFGNYKNVLGKVGGLVVILFGLVTLGIVRIPWLFMDMRPHMKQPRAHHLLNSGLIGILFAAGWTPCVGTTLGAILTLGLSQENSSQAMVLSSGYALGLGLPFLGLGLVLDRALGIVRKMGRHLRTLQRISGLFLILIGILLITDRMTLIAIWAQRNGFYLNLPLGGTSAPTYLAAIAAGTLSFLSPCVLPLVPAYLGYLSRYGLPQIDS